jgi:hypothetical protein
MLKRRMSSMLMVAMAVVVAGASMCSGADVKSSLPFGSDNTVAVVRLKSIDKTLTAVTELVTSFDPNTGAQVSMMAKMQLAQLAGIDQSKPAAILILDPKKYTEPIVGVFALKDAAAFRKVQIAKTLVVGQLGLLSNDEAALAEVGQALKARGLAAVPTADMTEMIVANANIKEIMTRYKMEIQTGLAVAKMQLGGGMGGMEPDGAAPPDPKKQMAMKALDYVNKLAAQIEKQGGPVEVGLNISKAEIVSRFMVEAAAGSDFAQFLAKNSKPVSPALAQYLPKNAAQTSIALSDPESMAKLGVGIVEIACDIFGLSNDEALRIRTAMIDSFSNFTGLQASAALVMGDGQAGVSLTGIKNSDAARKANRSLFQLANTGKIGEFLKTYGVAVKVTEKKREYGGIPIDRVEILLDAETILAALDVPADARAMMKQQIAKSLKSSYGHEDRVVMEMAYGKSLAVAAYGPSVDKVMDGQIELMKARGVGSIGRTAEYKTALARHPKDACMLTHVSLYAYSDMLGKMMANQMGGMGAMDIFPTRAELPATDDPISGSARISGTKATLLMHVPVKPIAAFADVMKKKAAKAMQDMMKNAQPQGGF